MINKDIKAAARIISFKKFLINKIIFIFLLFFVLLKNKAEAA